MRTAFAILGALLLVPAVLGFLAGFALACALPWLAKQIERESQRGRRGLTDWPTIPADRIVPPAPPPLDRNYYRRTRPS